MTIGPGDILPPDSGAPASPAGGQGFIHRMHPVLFALIALAGIFFLYQIIGGGIVLLMTGGKLGNESVGLVRWTTAGGQLLFILIPTILLARLRRPNLKEFLRLRAPGIVEIIAAVIGVFALQQMLVGYMAVQDLIPLPGPLREFLDTIKKLYEDTYRLLLVARSPVEFIWVVIVVALVPAVTEELLFRGLVQSSMEESIGGLGGALFTGLIFGAYHLIPTSIVPLSVLGIYLGFLVYRTKNITVAMSAHFFNNLVACWAMYVHIDDDFIAVAPSGGGGVAAMVINFLLFTVVFLGATAYLLSVTRTPRAEPVSDHMDNVN